jgi:hypothetical protein
MTDHYVRHMLRDGDHVTTEFDCRAADDAPCRTVCLLCINEQRECCQCDYVEVDGKEGRTPKIEHGHECSICVWLEEDAPEESFNGEPQPVRGPDWQPIVPEWNGDNYDWDYAE